MLTFNYLDHMKKCILIMLATGVVILSSCKKDPPVSNPVNYPISEVSPGKWRQMLDTNNIEIIQPAYFSIGESGFTVNPQTNEVFEYDAVKNKVIKKVNFPGPRRQSLATAFSIGNKGYYGLGLGQKSIKEGSQAQWNYVYRVDFWEYNPVNDSWTRKADLPIPPNPNQQEPKQASFFGAYGIAINNKGYVGSGRDINFSLRKYLYEYNPQSNTWAVIATPDSVNYAPGYSAITVAFSIGNKGYIGNSDTLWEFNPLSATPWKVMNFVSQSFKNPVLSLGSKTKGYIYGSVTNLNKLKPELKNDFYEFTPNADKGSWKRLSDFEGTPRAGSAGFILKDKVYMGFGSNLSASVLTDMWEYSPLP